LLFWCIIPNGKVSEGSGTPLCSLKDDMKQTLAILIEETLADTTTTAKTPDLPALDSATQESVGTLPLALCRLYLLTNDVIGNKDKKWSDDDATDICRYFGSMVTRQFSLTIGTEFDICANFEVARELKLESTAPPKTVSVCDDKASY
jgi:hypothetical protein